MAATEHSFSDTPPRRLYLDADFVLAAIVTHEAHSQRCKTFLTRVADMRLTTIYVSSLWWVEFADTVMRERWRTRLDPEEQARYRLDRWQEPLIREAYLQDMLKRLEGLLSAFEWAEISVTRAVRSLAIQYMGEHALRGQDAIHLASMVHAGVYDLASLDESFRKVSALHLWNDLIHTAPS